MKILGFNIRLKFGDIGIQEAKTRQGFIDKVAGGFRGLLIYHGNPFVKIGDSSEDTLFNNVLYPAAAARQCAILEVDYNVFSLPPTCNSPYIYFFSQSVPNGDGSKPFAPSMRRLIKIFEPLDDLPPEDEMMRIWQEIDYYRERHRMISLLDKVQFARGPGTQLLTEAALLQLRPCFGERLRTISDVKREYLRLRNAPGPWVKSDWQNERESITHNLLQDSFYALLARPGISRSLEGRGEAFPDGLRMTLQNWRTIHLRISDLLTRGYQRAGLGAAPTDQNGVGRSYKGAGKAGSRSSPEELLQAARWALESVNEEVEKLLELAEPKHVKRPLTHSPLIELCKILTTRMSALKGLPECGDPDAR